MNGNDIIFCLMIFCAVPVLAYHYLSNRIYSSNFRIIAVGLGVLSLLVGLGVNFVLIEALGVGMGDAIEHHIQGSLAASKLRDMDLEGFLESVNAGNITFQLWIGLLYFSTGVTAISVQTLNSLFGFWASLLLMRYFGEAFSHNLRVSKWSLFILVIPNLVYWCSLLMKEALMFWAICLWYTSVIPESKNTVFNISLSSVIGLVVGILMRPYLMVVWVISVALVTLIKSGRFLVAILMTVIIFFSVVAFKDQFGLESVTDIEKEARKNAALQSAYEGEGSSSNIDYGGGHGTFMIDGAISLFFRPFIWSVDSGRKLLAALEIWTITTLIVVGWALVGKRGRKWLLRQPSIMVSLSVCVGFCFFFTYIVNEGQIVRFRIQALPALLTLAYWPLSLRRIQENEKLLRKVKFPTLLKSEF